MVKKVSEEMPQKEKDLCQLVSAISKLYDFLNKYNNYIAIYNTIPISFVKYAVGIAISLQFEKEYHNGSKILYESLFKEIEKFNNMVVKKQVTLPVNISGSVIELELKIDTIKYDSLIFFKEVIFQYKNELIEHIAAFMQNNGATEYNYTKAAEEIIKGIDFIQSTFKKGK